MQEIPNGFSLKADTKLLIPENPKIGPSILVVDGSVEYAEMLKEFIITSGISYSEFHVAFFGQEGINKFLEHRGYDIVITGWLSVEGEKVAHEVKKYKPETVVMMVTAGCYGKDLPTGNRDLDFLLIKPFRLDDFENNFKKAANLAESRSQPIVDFTV